MKTIEYIYTIIFVCLGILVLLSISIFRDKGEGRVPKDKESN